ncbi:MAG: hypothetical protein H0T56_01660 [Pseudaminobacter sp.]|nr:hypothetical protein [Pseudaminobacter sp.]
MSQLSLFDSQKPLAEKRPPNPDFIRKHLNRLLRLARNAEILPWSEAEAKDWERRFPELALLLPAEEGEALRAAFAAEMHRLWKAA